ncbi:MAG: 16S rRNA (adenine(1518)-N(6)/adenine(1519)-N(6))-dimethyltransferase RsmA [Oceanospirillales bacterium]|uniref:Ribosomal RNA small subunit methyltransferase A n=1 Tax=Marinobacterium halophilum TaxID=267374 RepID=A0A2P8EYK7_9GAMM|nr:16S rRNA (adenine(1518)-N(6)/adenine(1519)-N(6))-dimethyltransferase RsmA [Marinobacterium halophilum]MBR9828586.1 16S rRNA (adenine(1518)-N(6)/adenine(1519)-N(6))-dimethyltransferase RsmA [Oceanospirillales bacterium]PSL14557.1 dimethyladenosine transferase [Marinobacterium halophilum]
MSKKPVGHKARKRFGQNFLHDQGVIGRIIRAISPKPTQHMVEIGPGLGALTEELLSACDGHLDAVELDRDLVPILRTQFFRYADTFAIHEADALKFDFASLKQDERPLRIVGNLPYNISTPLIFHLLSFNGLIHDMHFMLQKEVVDRLAAGPGDNHYGRLGIMAQYYCRVEPLFIVPPEAFSPAPKVDSAIVRLVPYTEPPIPAKDVRQLQNVVRTAFGQRRKTLRNNLKPLIDAERLQQLGIDPGLRPERLTLAQFVAISDALTDAAANTPPCEPN